MYLNATRAGYRPVMSARLQSATLPTDADMNDRTEQIVPPSDSVPAPEAAMQSRQTSQNQPEKSAVPAGPAIEFKGLSHQVLRVVLREACEPALRAALTAFEPQGATDFEWQAAVIDLEQLSDQTETDLEVLCRLLREIRLHPVAVAGGSDALREQAERFQLGWLSALREPRRSASLQANGEPSGNATEAASRSASAATSTLRRDPSVRTQGGTMTIDRPIRSGQQVYARDTDLIIIGPVSPGAEVIADGNVHVYGSLQGRAIAGARGRRDAKIFARDLSAELVAVAGVYRTFEDGVPAGDRGRPVCILLDGETDRLAIKAI
jgi:septum site-determining protein MinC